MADGFDIMKAFRETSIRDKMPPCVANMLDLWHSLCDEHLDFSIEVMLADRHECREFKNFKGELNTALPMNVDGKLRLIVYVESISSVTPIILTHELGHWIVKFQGFEGVIFRDAKHSNNEIMLNSLSHHRAIYSLQITYGIDPQAEIDARAEHDITLFRGDSEPANPDLQLSNALLIADDRLSCSSDKDAKLTTILAEYHPKTATFVDTILDTASHYDFNNPDKTKRFERMIIKKLRLSKDWYFPDEVGSLKTMHKINA